jgi:hypothetical protein
LQGVDDPSNVLAEYRYSDLDTILATRYPNLSLEECLLKDKLVAKFFAPYSTVVSSKRFMVETQCLDESTPILYKNAGKYCPFKDEWPLAQQVRA